MFGKTRIMSGRRVVDAVVDAGTNTASKYVYRVARPLTRSQPGYWSTRARVARQLFPSDVVIVHKDGNTLDKDGKIVLKTDQHLGKRDIIEYLRKIYGLRALKVNSMNYYGKLKRRTANNRRGAKTYRTRGYKKFIVTLDPQEATLPEQRLASEVIEAEVVRPTAPSPNVSAKV